MSIHNIKVLPNGSVVLTGGGGQTIHIPKGVENNELVRVLVQANKASILFYSAFPKHHRRAGEPTGFQKRIKTKNKIHTLRHKGHTHEEGTVVFLRYVDCNLSFATAVIHSIAPATLELKDGKLNVLVNNVEVRSSTFAHNDGLSTEDLISWFFPKGSPAKIEVDVIHLTTFKYGG